MLYEYVCDEHIIFFGAFLLEFYIHLDGVVCKISVSIPLLGWSFGSSIVG